RAPGAYRRRVRVSRPCVWLTRRRLLARRGARQGIALFGFDVLYALAAPDVPVVVDVNYFPGPPPRVPFRRRLFRPTAEPGRVVGVRRLPNAQRTTGLPSSTRGSWTSWNAARAGDGVHSLVRCA